MSEEGVVRYCEYINGTCRRGVPEGKNVDNPEQRLCKHWYSSNQSSGFCNKQRAYYLLSRLSNILDDSSTETIKKCLHEATQFFQEFLLEKDEEHEDHGH